MIINENSLDGSDFTIINQEIDCDEIETTPLNQPEKWVLHADRVRYIHDQFHSLAVLFLTLACIVMCVVFYIICPRCLFFILIFCFILCPFYPGFNLPLWIAIIMLMFTGWSFSAGALSINWISK